MSRYQELRDAFAALQERDQDFMRANMFLAERIALGLYDYLEMPHSYQSPPLPGGNIRGKYLYFYKIEDDSKDREETQNLRQAVLHNWDGHFRFGLGILLEQAVDAFPKQVVVMAIKVRRFDDKAEITISDKTVHCHFDGNDWVDIERAHQVVFELLLEWTTRLPGSVEAMPKVGFEILNKNG